VKGIADAEACVTATLGARLHMRMLRLGAAGAFALFGAFITIPLCSCGCSPESAVQARSPQATIGTTYEVPCAQGIGFDFAHAWWSGYMGGQCNPESGELLVFRDVLNREYLTLDASHTVEIDLVKLKHPRVPPRSTPLTSTNVGAAICSSDGYDFDGAVYTMPPGVADPGCGHGEWLSTDASGATWINRYEYGEVLQRKGPAETLTPQLDLAAGQQAQYPAPCPTAGLFTFDGSVWSLPAGALPPSFPAAFSDCSSIATVSLQTHDDAVVRDSGRDYRIQRLTGPLPPPPCE
jgi:hypothetical protein